MRLLSTAATLTLLGTVTHGKNHPHLTMKQNLAQLQHGGGGDLLDYDVRKSTTGGNVGTGGADKGGFFGGAKDLMPKLPPLSFEDKNFPKIEDFNAPSLNFNLDLNSASIPDVPNPRLSGGFDTIQGTQ